MRRHRWDLRGQYNGQTGTCWLCRAQFRWERVAGPRARGRIVQVFSTDGGKTWAQGRPDCVTAPSTAQGAQR